jgi:hypothetical protein
MPLSKIFQSYLGSLFYWWMKPEYTFGFVVGSERNNYFLVFKIHDEVVYSYVDKICCMDGDR